MARKPSSRRHSTTDLDDVNLVPIMSILVILIPMLIYAFTFFEPPKAVAIGLADAIGTFDVALAQLLESTTWSSSPAARRPFASWPPQEREPWLQHLCCVSD